MKLAVPCCKRPAPLVKQLDTFVGARFNAGLYLPPEVFASTRMRAAVLWGSMISTARRSLLLPKNLAFFLLLGRAMGNRSLMIYKDLD